MKKIFEYLGLISLMCFSFVLTEKTVTVVQETDDIMINIKANVDRHYTAPIDATISGNNIIPGIAGKDVNVEKSYQAMTKIGVYDPNFLVYNIKKSKISIDNNLDKYITKGHPSKRMVSMLFIVEGKQIDSIVNLIGNNKVSFIVGEEHFKNELEVITASYKKGHDFIIISEKNSEMRKIEKAGLEIKFCYNPTRKVDFSKYCQKNKKYSLGTENVISSKPLQTVRGVIEPGSILVFQVNDALLKELPNIISYINYKGYKIESLDAHLQEN